MTFSALVLLTLWLQPNRELVLPPEVIRAAYLGQFEEEKPKFLYEFYNVQNTAAKEELGKDYLPTIKELEAILAQNKNFPLLRDMAMSMTLFSYNLMGDYENTISVGNAYLRQHKKEGSPYWLANILYSLAEGYYYHHDLQSAERLYLQIKTDYSGQEFGEFAKGSLGWVYLNQGRYTEAWGLFKDLIDHSDNPTIRSFAVYGSGISFYYQAVYDTALFFFSFDKERYDSTGLGCALAYDLIDDNLYWAGFCFERLQNPKDTALNYLSAALDCWKKLVSEYPDSPRAAEAAFRIGNLYFRNGEYRNGVSYLKIVVERYPKSPFARDANLQMAQSYFNLGEDREAQRYYKSALGLFPEDSADILAGMDASLYRMAKNTSTAQALEEIVADYSKYLPRSEHLSELRYEMAMRYYNEKNFANAASNFQQVVLTSPNSSLVADAQLHLAYTYDAMKDWVRSAEAYRWFIDNLPGHPALAEVLYRLGLAYEALGDKTGDRNYFRQALETYEKVSKKYPGGEFSTLAGERAAGCKNKLK